MSKIRMRPPGLRSIFRIAISTLLLALALSRMAACAESSLPQLKKIYEQQTEKIETDFGRRLEAALAEYGKALVSTESRCKKSGDLKGLLAVREEKERLQTEKKVPDEDSSGVLTSVADARVSYRRAVANAKVRRATQIKTLSVNYAKHLTALRKQLVIQDKLEEAQVVDGEIKRIDLIAALVATEIPNAAKPDPKPVPREREPTPAKLSPSELGAERKLAAALKKRLVLHYDFSASDDGKITDLSKQRNHGEGEEVEIREGVCVFDRPFACVKVPHDKSLGFKDEITMAVWANVSRPPTKTAQFISKWLSGFEDKALNVGRELFPRFECFRADILHATTPLTVGQWHHVAGTMDRDEVRLYVDGRLNARCSTDGKTIGNSGGPLYLGRNLSRKHVDAWVDFHGSLDDVMIWDRALSDEEVQALYRRGREK